MLKGYEMRLFPTKSQEHNLWRAVGAARWIWNWGIETNQNVYEKTGKNLSGFDLIKRFSSIRKTEEYKWLSEISFKIGAVTLLDLYKSYKDFFAGRSRLPKFKKKNITPYSFGLPADRTKCKKNGTIFLEKMGWIKYKFKSDVDLTKKLIQNPRIKFKNNKWILCFSLKIETRPYTLNSFNIGIDVGIRSLAVISCNNKKRRFKNINRTTRVIRIEKQLKHYQRILSRKYLAYKKRKKIDSSLELRSCKNREKIRMKVKRLHSKLHNIRKEYQHKVTTTIVNLLPKKICMESLDLMSMLKNKIISKDIRNQTLSRFKGYIVTKSQERGIEIIFADKYFPSSKKCSCCGNIKKDLKMSDKLYKCNHCNYVEDRDFNAAINLEKLTY